MTVIPGLTKVRYPPSSMFKPIGVPCSAAAMLTINLHPVGTLHVCGELSILAEYTYIRIGCDTYIRNVHAFNSLEEANSFPMDCTDIRVSTGAPRTDV